MAYGVQINKVQNFRKKSDSSHAHSQRKEEMTRVYFKKNPDTKLYILVVLRRVLV